MGHQGFPGQDMGMLGQDRGHLQSWGHVSTAHSFIHSLTGSFSLAGGCVWPWRWQWFKLGPDLQGLQAFASLLP